MIDSERKKAILNAEREFERKEILSRALAVRGVTLVGKITSVAPDEDASVPDMMDDQTD